MTDSLDDGRVSFGNRDEIELATAIDPVCGSELKRADAAGAIDVHGDGVLLSFVACRDAFVADPDRYQQTTDRSARRVRSSLGARQP